MLRNITAKTECESVNVFLVPAHYSRILDKSLLNGLLYCYVGDFLLGCYCNRIFVICLQSGIGFGKLESYTKLDKLGEVSQRF